MNSLSWLLYATSVVGNLGPAMGLLCMLTGAGAVAGTFFTIMFASEGETLPKSVRWMVPAAIVAFLVSGAIGILIPSRDAMMLIAASEVGETVIASKEAQAIGGEAGALATDSLKLLRKYVTEQLGEEAK